MSGWGDSGRALVAAGALVVACGRPSVGEPEPPEEEAPAPVDAEVPTEVAAPVASVVAAADGVQGRIVVEDRGDLRVLLIGGVLQGSARIGDDVVQAPDPIVDLVQATAGYEGRALLVGLGTGRTAMQLGKRRRIDVVELEPKVIEFAREHFGYEGKVIEGDGAEFLRSATSAYRAIVLDAFDGTRPAAELVTAPALAHARALLLHEGVLAIRLYGQPDAAWIDEIRRGLAPFDVQVFALGTSAKHRNLYLLASRHRHHIDPMRGNGMRRIYPATGGVYDDVELVGYLHREAHSGALALDLPHEEMGAQRFLIVGPKAAALAAKLPKGAQFPTENDGTGPGMRKVPRSLVGGEGVLRSDLRFSPVVVGVRGSAKLLAEVHPDTAMRVPKRVRLQAAARLGQRKLVDEPRLPYGGALYELTVEEVRGVFTRKDWDRARNGGLRGPLRRARTAIGRGDLGAARAALADYLDAFDRVFGSVAPLLAARAGIADLHLALTPLASTSPAAGMPRARICERLADLAKFRTGDASRLVTPLNECAIAQYEAALRTENKAAATMSAAALAKLLDREASRLEDDDPTRAKRLRHRLTKLRKSHRVRP